MFLPKPRAEVGMVQCVSEGHGKPPGRKTVGTRRRAGPCKEGDQPVHAKLRSLTFATSALVFGGNIFTHPYCLYIMYYNHCVHPLVIAGRIKSRTDPGVRCSFSPHLRDGGCMHLFQ